ncbi:hypothetical protein EXU57_19145 [Segetibacter sp. 3557_3]|uniref:hypothetical protein n=1 Tax=Segetibacter sp. 3557_3 TaxID=2547429 RepID=UPI0010591C85|nr:hypothetical protein [Segetibacter sp. 3557_3]TDH21620.1 hypothetical protein EXU57_19145 [Segetibacter sp. 3557_3]
MVVLRSPLFLVSLILFLLHQCAQKLWGLQFSLVDNYLDNLVAMPVILPLLQAERIGLFRKSQAFKLSRMDVVGATTYIIIISEVVFPSVSNRFTADWRDVLCYAAGGYLFYIFNHRPTGESDPR